MTTNYRGTFQRYGRSYQLVIHGPEDLRAAAEMDSALWVATSAPTDGLRADAVLLDLLDVDRDRRVKVGEFKRAIRWTLSRLKDTAGLARGATALRRAELNTDDAEGRAIDAMLLKLLRSRGDPEDGEVPLDAIRALKKRMESQPVSEGGVVLPDAAPDPETRRLIEDLLATVGGVTHPGGAPGVDRAHLDAFADQAARHAAWLRQGTAAKGAPTSEILPLGEATAGAYEAYGPLAPKIDQYFAQCEALAVGRLLKQQLWPSELTERPSVLDGAERIRPLLEQSPVAEPSADGVLDLDGARNPFYEAALADFRARVVAPLLRRADSRLTHADWTAIKQRLAPYGAWRAAQPDTAVGKLPLAALEAHLAGGKIEVVRGLIERSVQSAFVLDNVRLAEKLALYQGYLLTLANSFVSFPDLYDPGRRALFEEGTLVMDGRRFNLCVRVPDRAEHAACCNGGTMFVMYVVIEHKLSGRTAELAVPITSGSQGNIDVGKRGVFEHVEGTQWTARVVRIVDRPVSLREAMWEPFKRLGAALTSKIESITSAAEKQMQEAGTGLVGQTLTPPPGGAPATPAPAASNRMAMGGVLAGGGIAVAALGSSAAFITKTLAGLKWWQVLSGIGGIALAVLVPTTIVAAIRLRARDLSRVLEGSGWAINSRMRLSRAQSHAFTERPRYPRDSRLVRPVSWWLWSALILAALLWIAFAVVRGGWR